MPCPFKRFGMLHKIFKISLDHYVLDAKGTMQKSKISNEKGVWPCHAILMVRKA